MIDVHPLFQPKRTVDRRHEQGTMSDTPILPPTDLERIAAALERIAKQLESDAVDYERNTAALIKTLEETRSRR